MTNRIQQEIKDLQDKLVSLQTQLALINNASQTEPTINFKDLSYRFLMAYYIEHNHSWFRYDIAPEVYTAWREAYQVFKDKRTARDEQIKTLMLNTIEQFNGQLVDIDSILMLVANPIKILYETITPFDCEDEKWLYPVYSRSWTIRIEKKVHAYFDDYRLENSIRDVTKKWVVDLRK